MFCPKHRQKIASLIIKKHRIVKTLHRSEKWTSPTPKHHRHQQHHQHLCHSMMSVFNKFLLQIKLLIPITMITFTDMIIDQASQEDDDNNSSDLAWEQDTPQRQLNEPWTIRLESRWCNSCNITNSCNIFNLCNNPISCISSYGNFCSTWIHALLCKRKVEISSIQSLMCKGISGVPWAQAMHQCQSVTREQCISDVISCATRCNAIWCAICNVAPSPLYFFWRLPAGEPLKICDIDYAIWGPPMGAPHY